MAIPTMTVLDKFLSFARALPADQLESVEESLAALMESLSPEYDFTPAELSELDARISDANPEFADPANIAGIFGKPFRA